MNRLPFAIALSFLLGSRMLAQKYFPDRGFNQRDDLNNLKVSWYQEHLQALAEPSLWSYRNIQHGAGVRISVAAVFQPPKFGSIQHRS
jgi:hypothetical protein